MTSYRRINSRTLNNAVQQQDNMVTFMKPISQAIYPNYFSVPDASLNSLLVSTSSSYSATASSQLTFDGTTLKDFGNLDVSGNTTAQKLKLFNNLDVSGNTALQTVKVFNNLDVSGNTTAQKLKLFNNLDVSGNVNVQFNVSAYGTILAQQYLAGQVINVRMLGYTQTDLSQNTLIINAGVTSTLFSYSYTPKNANSYLLVEYQSVYSLAGSGSDTAEAYLYVNDGTDNIIGSTNQRWIDASGGGTRSGVIFPIVGRYTNGTVVAKTLRVDVFNNSIGDSLTVNGDNSTWLKITEIGR
jgi:hypothetical protein